jgi:hypothetical protein
VEGQVPHRTGEVLPFRPGILTAGVLSLLLYFSLLGLPLLGVLVAPMSAVPVLSVRGGSRAMTVAWGWPALALALLAGADRSGTGLMLLAGYMMLVVLPSVSVSWWSRAGWSEGRWVAVTTGVGLVTILGLVLALSQGHPVEATRAWVHQAAGQAEAMYTSLGMSRGEVGLMMDRAESWLSWILPGLVTGYLVLTLFWLRPRLGLLGLPVQTGPFEAYRNDEWVSAAFALAGAGTLLLRDTPRWVAVNLLVAVLILCFVQGLAMIRSHVVRFVGRGLLVRWGLGLICLQIPLAFVVMALGMIDSFHSLRPAPASENGRTE